MSLRRTAQKKNVGGKRVVSGTDAGTCNEEAPPNGFVRASELPADPTVRQSSPAATATESAKASPTLHRMSVFPWDLEDPSDYVFNMQDALEEIRCLSSGHQLSEFELAEFVHEGLAEYEHARTEMAAEHPMFHLENELKTLYRFYPGVDWLKV